MINIKGGTSDTFEALKEQMAKDEAAASRQWIVRVPSGKEIRVRFLTGPEKWFKYFEHYSDETKYFPCIGDGCPGCGSSSEKVQRKSKRYLANVLDVKEGRVVPLKIPMKLANRLITRYERYGNTMTDRDYILMSSGTGFDTEYDLDPMDKSDVDLSRYQLIDLREVLVDAYSEAFGTTEPAESKTVETKESDEVPFDKGSPEKEADEDSEDYITEEQMKKMGRPELNELAEALGLVVEPGWNKGQLIEALLKFGE